MSTVLKFIAGLCLVAVFAAGGMWGMQSLLAQDAEGGGGQRSNVTRVALATPEERQVEEDVSGVGTLRAIRSVDLMPSVAGRVTEVRVASGDAVLEGEVLVQLDDRAERAAVADAEATLAETRSDFRRFEELGDSNTAAEARVEQARAAYLRAEAALQSARADLEDKRIVAPFDGTLGVIDVEPGTFLGMDAMVTSLFDLTTMEVRVSLPERYFDRVTPGQLVSMRTPAYPDQTFEGKVAVRAPEIDLETRSFDVRARIDNPDGRLVAGMFANARLILDTYSALAIPDDSIISEGLSTFVYTVSDTTAHRTEIVPGNSVDDLTEVREGLDADDRVVVLGWDNLSDGAEVEIDEDVSEEAIN